MVGRLAGEVGDAANMSIMGFCPLTQAVSLRRPWRQRSQGPVIPHEVTSCNHLFYPVASPMICHESLIIKEDVLLLRLDQKILDTRAGLLLLNLSSDAIHLASKR